MHSIVVYTAFTKGYDILRMPPPHWRGNADFVAFLDEPEQHPFWDVRMIERKFSDPCRNAKIHKVLPHIYFPNAKYSIWMDGSIEAIATIGLQQLINTHLQFHDLAIFEHRFRKCIYEEAEVCIASRKDTQEVINRQMQKYRGEGYPVNNGLVEGGVLIRRHSEQVKRFNETWHTEIVEHSRRDQLSFNYVARKIGLQYKLLPGSFHGNPYFKLCSHDKYA